MTTRLPAGPAARTRRYLYGLVALNVANVWLVIAVFAYHLQAEDGIAGSNAWLAVVGVLAGLGGLFGAGIVRNIGAASSSHAAAQEALRDSEARMAQVAHSLEMAQRIARLGSWEWDIGSGRERWSDQNYRNLGYQPGACEPTEANFYQRVHPEDRDKVAAAVRGAIAGKSGYDLDLRIVCPDGAQRIMRTHAEPVLDESGNVRMLRGTLQDVTDERMAEQEAARLARRLSDAQRIARIGNWEWDARTKEEWWSDEVYRIFGVEPGSFAAGYEEFNRRIHPEDRERLIAAIERTQSGEAPPYVETFRILRPDGSERIVRETGEALFDPWGNLVGLSGTDQDVTEQHQVEAKLAEAARRLETAQRIARVVHWEWDPASDLLDWPPQMREVLGLPPGDQPITNDAYLEMLHPDDRAPLLERMRRAVDDGESYQFEYRFVLADGSVKTLLEYAEPFMPDGAGRRRLRGTIQDITELRRARDELALTLRRLDDSQAITGIGNWEWDIAAGTEWWSNQQFRNYGLEPDHEMVEANHFARFVHPDDRERALQAVADAVANATPIDIEFRTIGKDGVERILEAYGEPEFDTAGRPIRMVGTTQDITDRKRAERRLAEAVENLNRAQHLAGIGSWERDLAGGRETWSDECYRLHGLEPGSLRPAGAGFLDHVHPEDQDAVRAAYEGALEGKEPLDIEYRLIGADGVERTVLAHGEVSLDESGRAVRMSGTIQDVTERRRRERLLRETEQRFTLAFQLNPGMTAISEVETGRHVDVNDKWIEITGYSREEAIGRTAHELDIWANPEDRRRVVAMLRDSGRFRDVEVQFRMRHGELRDFLISGEPFPAGDRPHMLIVGHDITDRKRAEQAIRESEARLDAFFTAAPAGMAILGEDYRYVRLNETLAMMHGVERDIHVGRRPSEILPPEMARFVEAVMARTLEHGEWIANEEDSVTRSDGTTQHWVYSQFPIPGNEPGHSALGVVVVDISELKKAQEELRLLNAELEQRVLERTAELRAAQDELVRSERLATLGRLTATVSHELRNPLGAMRMSLYVIERKTNPDDERMANAIARVNRSITRCDRIIDELLDFTRIRELDLQDLEIDRWLAALLDEQRVPDGIRIRRKFGASGICVLADPDRLRRAVINVYENACQAMTGAPAGSAPKGGNALSVATRAGDDRLELIFEDTGPGIADDSLARIFEPLFSTKNFGVGLGLPVVRQIVEQHGGGVEASNRRVRGARFVLWLPRRRVVEERAA